MILYSFACVQFDQPGTEQHRRKGDQTSFGTLYAGNTGHHVGIWDVRSVEYGISKWYVYEEDVLPAIDSYIGNAPNFMVRSISEEAGTPMPSFFGYILKYTLVFLVPCFVVVTFIFFL